MLVSVKVLAGGVSERAVELPDDASYEQLLTALGLGVEEFVVLRGGRAAPLDELVREGEGDIRILRVVSGGQNRSILDQKCEKCGAWMEMDLRREGFVEVVSYFCPVCGLAYSIQRD